MLHRTRTRTCTRIFVLLTLLTSLSASGCFLFREDFPDDACVDNRDCFQAQGEVCNMATKTCEVPPDAAPVAPPPDADTTDADTTDADTTDADTTDASPPDAA